MIERKRRPDKARLVAGLVVLAVGVALLMNPGGILESVRFVEFWPVIVIVLGLFRASDAGNRERRRGGLVVAFIGCWLLIASTGLFGYDYGDSWPLVLVAIGLAVLLTAASGGEVGRALFFLLLGVWMLAATHEYFGLTFEKSWPVAIVALGLWIATGAFFPPAAQFCATCGGEECRCRSSERVGQ